MGIYIDFAINNAECAKAANTHAHTRGRSKTPKFGRRHQTKTRGRAYPEKSAWASTNFHAIQSTLKIMCVILLHVQHKAVAKNVHTLIQTHQRRWLQASLGCFNSSENVVISHFLIILLAFLHVQKEACYSSGYVVLTALSLVCITAVSASCSCYMQKKQRR